MMESMGVKKKAGKVVPVSLTKLYTMKTRGGSAGIDPRVHGLDYGWR
jgi:hypothetical protein